MSEQREALAAVLAAHSSFVYGSCKCEWTDKRYPSGSSAPRFRAHVAEVIIREWLPAQQAAVLREVADFCEAVTANAMGVAQSDFADGWREASACYDADLRSRAAALSAAVTALTEDDA